MSIKPKFISELKLLNQPIEGSFVTVQCIYEPRLDKNVKFDWFLNGEPIKRLGSRFEIYSNDGYCSLKISNLSVNDSGVLKLMLTNFSGSICSSVNLNVLSKSSLNSNPLKSSVQFTSSSFYKSSSYDTIQLNDQFNQQTTQQEFNQQTQQSSSNYHHHQQNAQLNSQLNNSNQYQQ